MVVTEQAALSFGGLLQQLRAESRLTQEELAEAAHLSPRAVSDLERGVNRTARPQTAELLAGALGLAGPARELFVAAARGKAPAGQVLVAVRAAQPLPQGAATASPYRGLAAFEEQHAALFFGRDTAAAEVLDRMSRRPGGAGLLVVSGFSGAGKSSLLRAGVLPRIRQSGLADAPGAASWPCLVFTPTRDPLDELSLRVAPLAGADAAAVRRGLEADPARFALTARQAATSQPDGPAGDSGGSAAEPDQPPRQPRLLLIVDQFEEVFTQCADEGQRRAFITALHAAATAGHGPDDTPAGLVVLAVRADFEARCAEYRQLAGAIQDRYLVTAMTERQLRMAITEPAKKAGAKVDDDLVGVLLTEVRNGQPGTFAAGVLPLLSYALDQAWRCRTGQTVTLAEYERTGGIEGGVAASAQRAYEHLTPGQQAAARQLFLRLTATSSDGIDIADRATTAELTEGNSAAGTQDVEAVLDAFAAERLLTLDVGTVEISHEALLTAWPLLRDTWLADTHADRIVRTRLHNTAADWDRSSRDPSYLYTGTLLQAATETAARIDADPARNPPLSQIDRSFLRASTRAHRRKARRRQGLLAFLTALVIGLTAVAGWAILATRDATRQRDVAVSRQLTAQSEALGDTDPVLSKLESIAAWRINPSDQARYAMLSAATLPGIAVLNNHTGAIQSMAFSPDGKTLATATGSPDGISDGKGVQLWDMTTHQPIGGPLANPGENSAVDSVAFSPDGKTLATGNSDDTVHLWDVRTRQPISAPLTETGPVDSVAFSPDGKTLATGTIGSTPAYGLVRLFYVPTHQQIGAPLTLPGGTGPVNTVAFSPDGKTLATSSYGGARLWNLSTHQQIGAPFTLPGGTGQIDSVAFSSDGKTLATGSDDGTARLWDVSTHRQTGATLTGSAGPVNSVAFSPDGKALATSSTDGTARLWDVSTHQQTGVALTGSAGPVNSVAFSPDGKILATGSADGTARLWNMALAINHPIGSMLASSSEPISSVAFSPDGKTLATGTDNLDGRGNGTIRLWNISTHKQLGAPINSSEPISSVAFSPDGKTLATGTDNLNSVVRLWNVVTHRQVGSPLPGNMVSSVAFSPDSKTLAIGNVDGTVQLLDVATRRQIGAPLTGSGAVASVAFSPDGKTLATGSVSQGGEARLWNVATRRKIGALAGSGPVNSVAFSLDGKTLATGGGDGTARLWDVATRQQIGNPLTGHASNVTSVAFSPDGKTLATGTYDGATQLWDVATQQQIGGPLPGNMVNSVAFSPDGKTLATGTSEGTVRLWDMSYLSQLVPYLCASVGRSLTPAEWAQYVQGVAYQSVCPGT